VEGLPSIRRRGDSGPARRTSYNTNFTAFPFQKENAVKPGSKIELIIDSDVKDVAEFMQSNMPAAKLVSVASAMAALAPILWGHFDAESVAALRLKPLPLILDDDQHRHSGTELRCLGLVCVGGGIAGEEF
jgi:hypothetical protein